MQTKAVVLVTILAALTVFMLATCSDDEPTQPKLNNDSLAILHGCYTGYVTVPGAWISGPTNVAERGLTESFMLRPGEYGIRTLSQNGTPKDRWKIQIIQRKEDTICFDVSDPYMLGMLGNDAYMKARLTIYADRIEGNILYAARGINWKPMRHVVMRPM